jgi:GT2 family glycosyltransferase
MIPVIGIPYISRSDLFLSTVTSINRPVQDIVIVDNSKDGSVPVVDEAIYIRMGRNMGVSWAWNTIIKRTRNAPWWVIMNADLRLGPDDLENINKAMDEGLDLVMIGSMALFGVSAACIRRVGWFDENFVPAYCEDNDYIYRCKLLGAKTLWMAAGWEHFGSATIKSDPVAKASNDRSYPLNVKYYQAKWGGVMGNETYETPFDKGGSPRDCQTLDLDRLKSLSWD